MCVAAGGEVGGLSLVSSVSPMVGKFDDMRPRALQACWDKNILLVEGVKYTICLVASFTPEGDIPVMRNGRAPMMIIPSLFAADIFIETGIRWCFWRPN